MQRENKNKHQTSAIMKGEVKDEGCSKKNKTDRELFKETIKKYVDEVIQELTLDEKIGVMSGKLQRRNYWMICS